MNGLDRDRLEQVVHDLREFATEVHVLGYSSTVVSGAEGRFLELSERIQRRADLLAQDVAARRRA